MSSSIEKLYESARDAYALIGVNTDRAIDTLSTVAISLHCWQGDDVAGFEDPNAELSGGIQATGNYPGKARTPQELRSDAEKAFSLIPGKQRFNLHAIYLEAEGTTKIPRNEIRPEHFKGWIDWAKSVGIGLDFNPTLFSHPNAASGFTLAHQDKAIRKFWIEHCQCCREIGAAMGRALGIADGHQRLDSRRHEGHAGQPPRSARTADGRLGRSVQETAQPQAQSRRRRGQALRHRLRELHGRHARVLPRLRREEPDTRAASTPATTTPPRTSRIRSRRFCASCPRSSCT